MLTWYEKRKIANNKNLLNEKGNRNMGEALGREKRSCRNGRRKSRRKEEKILQEWEEED